MAIHDIHPDAALHDERLRYFDTVERPLLVDASMHVRGHPIRLGVHARPSQASGHSTRSWTEASNPS